MKNYLRPLLLALTLGLAALAPAAAQSTVTRQVTVYPTPAHAAVGSGVSLNALIETLRAVQRAAPKQPGSGFETAVVQGIEQMRIVAVETLSPAEVQRIRYEQALQRLRQLVSDYQARPGAPDRQVPPALLETLLRDLERTDLGQ